MTNIEDFIPPSIWKAAPVEQEPRTYLRMWTVMELPSGTRHFVGSAPFEGRVSTAIVEFDKEARCGRTKSGRVYELDIQPGYSSDGMYVFGAWLAGQGLSRKDAKDVTGEYE